MYECVVKYKGTGGGIGKARSYNESWCDRLTGIYHPAL